MSDSLRDSESLIFSNRRQAITLLVLSALLLIAFPVRFAETANAPAGMVYCPLSKRFQPVRPPKASRETNSFGDICAGAEAKEMLFKEFFLKNFSRTISLDENNLETLAFDVLTHGKPAFDNLPGLPQKPFENAVKLNKISAFAGNSHEQKLFWKKSLTAFVPNLAARPPTDAVANLFPIARIFPATELSRRIAPRAPPLA